MNKSTNLLRWISASRLRDGRVVYLRRDGTWSANLEDAQVFDETAVNEALARAKADELEVCNPHVVEAPYDAEGRPILSARERFRRDGPDAVLRRLGYADFIRAPH